jgi:hypothetical protein
VTIIKKLLSSPCPWVIGVGVIAILILWDDD